MGRVETRKHFNWRMAMSCLLIMVSTMNYGFDNSGFSTTQAMNAFQRQFGEINPKTGKYYLPPSWLSLFNSLPFIGFVVGMQVGSFISQRFGRRWCMFSMSAYALISATVCVTSQNKHQIMAGRILNCNVVPIFQSEIVPAQIRGMAVGSYQFSLMLGGLLVNVVCRGTSTLNTSAAWRIPIGLFYVIPTIIMCTIWFIPESPRWLLTQDRTDEAYASFKTLRSGTMPDAEIDAEFETLQDALRLEPEQGRWVEIFQGVNLKRTGISVTINILQQATGQAFVSTYGAVYVRSIGTLNAFNFTLILAVCNLTMVSIGLFLNDRVGRRPLLFIGGMLQFAAILSMGSLGTQKETLQTKTGIVALLVIFAGCYVFSWAPMAYVISSEVPALRLRDATQRTAGVANIVTSFLVTFSIPYLLYEPYAGLGSKVGFIFAGIITLALAFTFFCVPECKGKSLEQIDRMFQEKVPIRQFGNYAIDTAAFLDPEKAVETVLVEHKELK
ncbi:hypothetical protein LIPSTDRAFT_104968 [Lipomyces starkeyi NRRL Y-11557]|uniref:Major facilitator superfamily (MFS) profile domain-containing protein n=1 Tax=Lipomyces starkeyi NRRL Y-11557 TaxID=675824 RepID=A0A1E3Q6R3_LIPST|nr:hypothetical protein LIPSTDRAFT_104968 [Lipomyces starkeyi NRRL Y-11557]